MSLYYSGDIKKDMDALRMDKDRFLYLKELTRYEAFGAVRHRLLIERKRVMAKNEMEMVDFYSGLIEGIQILWAWDLHGVGVPTIGALGLPDTLSDQRPRPASVIFKPEGEWDREEAHARLMEFMSLFSTYPLMEKLAQVPGISVYDIDIGEDGFYIDSVCHGQGAFEFYIELNVKLLNAISRCRHHPVGNYCMEIEWVGDGYFDEGKYTPHIILQYSMNSKEMDTAEFQVAVWEAKLEEIIDEVVNKRLNLLATDT